MRRADGCSTSSRCCARPEADGGRADRLEVTRTIYRDVALQAAACRSSAPGLGYVLREA
jgi:hypothetical protein